MEKGSDSDNIEVEKNHKEERIEESILNYIDAFIPTYHNLVLRSLKLTLLTLRFT